MKRNNSTQPAWTLVDDLLNFNKIVCVTVGWLQVNGIRQTWQRRRPNYSGNQGYRVRYSVSSWSIFIYLRQNWLKLFDYGVRELNFPVNPKGDFTNDLNWHGFNCFIYTIAEVSELRKAGLINVRCLVPSLNKTKAPKVMFCLQKSKHFSRCCWDIGLDFCNFL